MRHALSLSVTLAGVLCATAPAAMIVHDPTNYAQLVAQAQTALEQLNSLRTQVDQGRRLIETLDEASGIGDVAEALDNGSWRSIWSDIAAYGAEGDGLRSTGALADRAKTLRDERRIYEPELENPYDQRLEAAGLSNARDMTVAEALAEAASDRAEAIGQLDQTLANAASARAVLDLQTQAALEQTRLANDQLRLQALTLAQSAEAQALLQAEQERAALGRRQRMAAYAATFNR